MSKPPKIDRKTLKQPDSFTAKGRNALSWAMDQRARFMPVLVVAIALVAGGYVYDWYSNSKLDSAWKAFGNASKLSEPQKWEDLKSVENKWKGTRPSLFAAVALADHHFGEAKKAAVKDEKAPSIATDAASAVEWYTKALQFPDLLPAEKQLLYIDRGGAYEIQKKLDEALKDYQMAAEFGGDPKPLALLNIARAFELKNETKKAIDVYEQIGNDFGSTEYAKQAKNFVRRLKSPLFGGQSS